MHPPEHDTADRNTTALKNIMFGENGRKRMKSMYVNLKYIEKTINKYILIKHGKDDYFSVLVIEKI